MTRPPSLDELWTAAHRARPLELMVRLVVAARVVPGEEWIGRRHEPLYPDATAELAHVTVEATWWGDALYKLNRELLMRAMAPGPVPRRRIVMNEQHRTVTLTVGTQAEGRNPWGLPALVLQVPQPTCPPGGDLLRLPPE